MDRIISLLEKNEKQLEELNRQVLWLLESRQLEKEFENEKK